MSFVLIFNKMFKYSFIFISIGFLVLFEYHLEKVKVANGCGEEGNAAQRWIWKDDNNNIISHGMKSVWYYPQNDVEILKKEHLSGNNQ